MNKGLQNLTENILEEKMKTQPDKRKIEIWQNSIVDIENYKKQGTVIRSKEMTIVSEKNSTEHYTKSKTIIKFYKKNH